MSTFVYLAVDIYYVHLRRDYVQLAADKLLADTGKLSAADLTFSIINIADLLDVLEIFGDLSLCALFFFACEQRSMSLYQVREQTARKLSRLR